MCHWLITVNFQTSGHLSPEFCLSCSGPKCFLENNFSQKSLNHKALLLNVVLKALPNQMQPTPVDALLPTLQEYPLDNAMLRHLVLTLPHPSRPITNATSSWKLSWVSLILHFHSI